MRMRAPEKCVTWASHGLEPRRLLLRSKEYDQMPQAV